MAITTADLKAFAARYRVHTEAIGVAALAAVVALTLGIMARRQAAPVLAERDRLRAATREVDGFRTAFKPATPEEDAFRLPDSLSVGVARDVRFSLAEQVAQRAEQNGLRDVRVRFAPADTALAPAAPDLQGSHVVLADYAITVDCGGGFAAVLDLVRRLPPSVALQRMTAIRSPKGVVEYHLSLAVFETREAGAHG